MKILTIVGARPQFIKAAIVSRALSRQPNLEESILHTGQHYDERMSDAFFRELDIPTPKHHLDVGSGTHGQQTGKMLMQIEEVLLGERPDAVLVYGDTNSTIAGALAAVKVHIPVVHVEAGLRSFNRKMPEEINRVTTDHISSLLFCPTQEAVDNLCNEGIERNVFCVGDVMYDCAQFFSQKLSGESKCLAEHSIEPNDYFLFTCHRPENTDNAERLLEIQNALVKLCKIHPVVFPVHPRVRDRLEDFFAECPEGLIAIPPVSYLEMIELTKNSAVVVTDSGGLQKEAFFFGIPCVTMRNETEWNETVQCGANIIAGANANSVLEATKMQVGKQGKLPDAAPYYGGGSAAAKIAQLVIEFMESGGSE